MTLKSCLVSMRLRTLPLSMSGIIMGICIAASVSDFSFWTGLFLVLTTASLQILSNLSNELGDSLRGTDTVDRQGIHYSIMDGEMTITEMKRLICGAVVVSDVFGLAMIGSSFGGIFGAKQGILILLGAAAIIAAMRYTLGRNPYGYRGKGDLFVFLFFGLVSTCGAYYICSHDMSNLMVLLPAAAIGCFSIGVLNVNNIRDMKTDAANRITVAIRMGEKGARIYQTILIVMGWVLMLVYSAFVFDKWWQWAFIVTMPLFHTHLLGVWLRKDRELDPLLPLLVMSTFAMSLLFGLAIVLG